MMIATTTSRKEKTTMKESTTKFINVLLGKHGNKIATTNDGATEISGIKVSELLYNGASDIDNATKSAIGKYFASRIINTEEKEDYCVFDSDGDPYIAFYNLDYGKFIRFFNTEICNDQKRYADLLRIEKTDFDPMVSNYLEEWYKNTHEGSSSGNSSSTNTPALVNETTTRTDNLTENTTNSGTSSNTKGIKVDDDTTVTYNNDDARTLNLSNSSNTTDRSNNDTETVTTYDNLTVTDRNKAVNMSKNLPNSISYVGAVAGNIPNLSWTTGTAQNQTETENTNTTSGSVTNATSHNNSVNTSGSNTGTDTMRHTGTVSNERDVNTNDTENGTTSANGQKTNTGTVQTATLKSLISKGDSSSMDSSSNSSTDEHKYVSTGRNGVLPQEAMKEAISYIKNSRAFDWLIKQLDSCFLEIL